VSLTNPAGEIDGSTNSPHNLHVGESVTIVGAANNSKYNGTYTITTVPSSTTFTISGTTNFSNPNNVKNYGAETGSVIPDTTSKPISTLTRVATTDSATATATGLPSGWFGANTGDTKLVVISGAATDAYTGAVTITCASAGCTSFTYPIAVTPSSTVSVSGATVGLTPAGGSASLVAGQITRSGTTAKVTGVTGGTFSNGQTLAITATNTPMSNESAYVGTWTISCTADPTCATFTFGPVTLSPSSPASGTMRAFSGTTPPDRDTVIRWIRGQDNFGDEKGPGSGVTIRPSVHGDVLHSRPVVINYGGTGNRIVVFYGSNDGVYRAVNGNQPAVSPATPASVAIGGVPPGGELWSLVLPEHFTQFNRLRTNSPEVKFPSTLIAGAQPKDYFVDGQTSAYQLTAADGTISTAYIFLTMRRGGRFMYGLDVTDPTTPKYLWKRSSGDAGFEELGQTWSRPRATILQGGGLGTTPVLVFGAGYDPAQDSEPPVANTVGRGIFIVKASDGTLVWSANSTCTTSATCRNVPGMNFAIPSDIAFVDRDSDGFIDKLYFGDTGGNVWRADVATASTADWTVTKLASLGCDDGAAPSPACSNSKAPRKFFFPPAVLAIGAPGASGSFDAVSIPSGDREHPLKNTATGSAYNVNDKFFMVNDLGTTVATGTSTTVLTSNVKLTDLFNATSTEYDGSLKGFFHSFTTGEKDVNAPLATSGLVFFATNQPTDPSSTCAANLGAAKAYAISPFLGTTTTNNIVGGGLPPSPVAGLITVQDGTNPDGTPKTTEEKFCIGCAADCTSCSALENSPPLNVIPKNLKRTYWYKK
jgi:type IV pilus assembly protein PilY1